MPVSKPRLVLDRSAIVNFARMFWWPLATGPGASKRLFRIGIVGVTVSWLALVVLALVNLAYPVDPVWFLVCALAQSVGASGLMAYSHRARSRETMRIKGVVHTNTKRVM